MAVEVPYGMGSILYAPGHTDACKKKCGHLFGVRYRWPDAASGKSKAKEEQNRFGSELDALARLVEIDADKGRIKGGAPVGERDIPAHDYIRDHVAGRSTLEPGSKKRYQFLIRRHMRGLTFPMGDFNSRRMREFVAALQEAGVLSSEISSVVSIIRKASEVAVADRLLEVNPTRGIEVPHKIRAILPREVPTLNQARAIVQAASPLGRDLILGVLGTGFRAGELLGVDGDCIKEDRTLEIRRQWGHDNEWIDHLKSKAPGATRRVPLDEHTYEIFTRRCTDNPGRYAFGKTYAIEYSRSKFGDEPHPISRNEASAEVRTACERVGGSIFTLHAFRHFYATQAFADGVSVEVVSGYLGHTSVDITLKTYIRFLQPVHDRMREAVGGFMKSMI